MTLSGVRGTIQSFYQDWPLIAGCFGMGVGSAQEAVNFSTFGNIPLPEQKGTIAQIGQNQQLALTMSGKWQEFIQRQGMGGIVEPCVKNTAARLWQSDSNRRI